MNEVNNTYNELLNYLSSDYDEVNGLDFYSDIFPDNEMTGELNTDYSKPNAIYLYTDEKDKDTQRRLRRRIMLKDTWGNDYNEFVKNNPMTLCSGLSYRSRSNELKHAQRIHALVFDLDSVGLKEINVLFKRMDLNPDWIRTIPKPTYVVMSGSGLHLYYVLNEPIDLFPNIKSQFRELKHMLTFRIWEYGETTQEKNIQYQGINQGFRMVGSKNDKYNLPIRAFKVGERVSLDYLNSYCHEEEKRVVLNERFFPSTYSLKEAEMKFPEWYQKVIVNQDYSKNKWIVKRDLYDWWKRKIPEVQGGHRYYYLMVLVIYAVKCDIPKKEVESDLYELYDIIKNIEHSNELTEYDIKSALDTYDPSYHNFPIDVIVEKTGIKIEKNKRNYRKQDVHLKLARGNLKILSELGEVKVGRPKGSKNKSRKKKDLVLSFIEENPKANPTEIARALNISRPTVYKYLKKIK